MPGESVIWLFVILILLVLVVFLFNRSAHFRTLSETDQMTSLMNYRGLYRNIEKLLKNKIHFSIVIIDIDDFRMFNRHSYKLGDDVLKEFTSQLKQAFPGNLMIARFRIGDEFILVFPNKGIQNAKNEMAAWKENFKDHEFSVLKEFPVKKITFSEGYAESNSEKNTPGLLFSEAEESLKHNKTLKVRGL
jgi:diguanylate cyclase (GGDEF)-like protein